MDLVRHRARRGRAAPGREAGLPVQPREPYPWLAAHSLRAAQPRRHQRRRRRLLPPRRRRAGRVQRGSGGARRRAAPPQHARLVGAGPAAGRGVGGRGRVVARPRPRRRTSGRQPRATRGRTPTLHTTRRSNHSRRRAAPTAQATCPTRASRAVKPRCSRCRGGLRPSPGALPAHRPRCLPRRCPAAPSTAGP